jgi:5-methylcytosine-specific restriction endonuclease McrA
MIGKKQSDKTKKKRSLSLTGRTQSIDERIAKSVAMKKRDWGERVSDKNKLVRNSIEIRLWREAVFARDNFTCQICGKLGGKLNAHHKNNFSEYPELRTAIDNGITLCEKCHIAFHKKYGKKTTEERIEGDLTLKR